MDHATQVSLIDRVLGLLDSGSFDMVESSSGTTPGRYTDPDELVREERLFRRLPQVVAHSSQLATPGDFVTREVGQVPLLVCRRADGLLGAFLNVCRHRGTQVEQAACGGGRRSFVCPYHAWTYDLQGALIHIPHEVGFRDLDRADLGLVPLAVDERAGLVWVTPTPGEPCDAAAQLGELLPELESFGFSRHHIYHPTLFRKQLNWKIAVEIFYEAYHVKRTHAESIYPVFIDNVALFDRFAPNLRNFFPKRTIASLRSVDRAEWALRPHGNLLYYLFPNTLILVQPDHASLFTLQPHGTDEVDLMTYTLVPEAPTSDKAKRHWDKNIAVLHGAIAEDLAMGESIQRGLRSGANPVMHFGRYEQSLGYFRDEIERALTRLG